MRVRVKHILSVIMAVIFMTPITIKLLDGCFHHHDHFVCTAKNEHHFHEQHEKCPVCSYEFSLFLSKNIDSPVVKIQKFENYYNYYKASHFLYFFNYSFLLRAPPTHELS